MTFATHPDTTDILIPLPGGEDWDPHTIHTHYFGFSVPGEKIGAFIYMRYQPVFNMLTGGVCIFQGMNNTTPLDVEHINFVVSMPYPSVVNNTIESSNGLRVEFLELGKSVRLSYENPKTKTSFDVVQNAVTPLLARGHVMPGEDEDTDPAQNPGGTEQYMRSVGELILGGRSIEVDCYAIRDRSWRQVRTESEVDYPPVGWSPMYFNKDLIFNQVGFEPESTEPAWSGIYDVPADKPSHYYAWVVNKGEAREITQITRKVLEYHPTIFAATKQIIDAVDETGETYHFEGEAIAMAHLPSWPHNSFVDSVYEWKTDSGEVSYGCYQEAWYQKYHRAMTRKLLDQSNVALNRR